MSQVEAWLQIILAETRLKLQVRAPASQRRGDSKRYLNLNMSDVDRDDLKSYKLTRPERLEERTMLEWWSIEGNVVVALTIEQATAEEWEFVTVAADNLNSTIEKTRDLFEGRAHVSEYVDKRGYLLVRSSAGEQWIDS